MGASLRHLAMRKDKPAMFTSRFCLFLDYPSGPPPTIDFGEHAEEIIRRMSSHEIEGSALEERSLEADDALRPWQVLVRGAGRFRRVVIEMCVRDKRLRVCLR